MQFAHAVTAQDWHGPTQQHGDAFSVADASCVEHSASTGMLHLQHAHEWLILYVPARKQACSDSMCIRHQLSPHSRKGKVLDARLLILQSCASMTT